jgi:hypothetical protein
MIRQASAAVASYCKRVLAAETVTETLRPERLQGELILARFPVTAVASIVEDGTTLAAADYELDGARGIITRMHSGRPCWWPTSTIVIDYRAGYELLATLPHDIERATINLVKAYYFASQRDPALRSEDVPGVVSASYLDIEHLPHDVRGLLAPYRNHRVG